MPTGPGSAILFCMEMKLTLTPDQPAEYRLRLQGRVTADWRDWLTDASVKFEDDQTLVNGVVRDQAALFGLLSFVRDLGAPLIAVEWIQ
jgi:hypothetical protein